MALAVLQLPLRGIHRVAQGQPPLPRPLWEHQEKNPKVEAVCVVRHCCLLATF